MSKDNKPGKPQEKPQQSKKPEAPKKLEISKPNQEVHKKVEAKPTKVLMRFKEDKFYNDLTKPIYEAGKIYEIEGSDFIERWKKRGGEIVTEESLQSEAPGEPVANDEQNGQNKENQE